MAAWAVWPFSQLASTPLGLSAVVLVATLCRLLQPARLDHPASPAPGTQVAQDRAPLLIVVKGRGTGLSEVQGPSATRNLGYFALVMGIGISAVACTTTTFRRSPCRSVRRGRRQLDRPRRAALLASRSLPGAACALTSPIPKRPRLRRLPLRRRRRARYCETVALSAAGGRLYAGLLGRHGRHRDHGAVRATKRSAWARNWPRVSPATAPVFAIPIRGGRRAA